MKPHTPTPWVIKNGDPITENQVADIRGIKIFGTYSATSCMADAEFIVHAVNNITRIEKQRDQLLEVAKTAEHVLNFYINEGILGGHLANDAMKKLQKTIQSVEGEK